MNLPPLQNPWTRLRGWVRDNRAQAEIVAITGVALGLLVLMGLITIVIVVRMLR